MIFENKIKTLNKKKDFMHFLHVLDSYADEVHVESNDLPHSSYLLALVVSDDIKIIIYTHSFINF